MNRLEEEMLIGGAGVSRQSLILTGGTGQYVTLLQPAGLNFLEISQEFTIMCTFRRAAAASSGILFSRGNASGATSDYRIYTLGGAGYYFEVGGTTLQSNFGTIGDTLWHHLAFIVRNNGGTYVGRIIIDGQTVSSEVAVGVGGTSSLDHLIGARRNSTNADFAQNIQGQFDEIRIYSTALTDAQVKKAAGNPESPGYTTGLVARYKCGDSDTSTTLIDSISGLNGTLVGGAAFDTTQYARRGIAGWGDSFTVGTGGTSSWLDRTPIRQTQGRIRYNGGVGGETAAQIQTRFNANPDYYNWYNVFFGNGRNGILVTPSATIIDILQANIAQLGHNDWMVTSIHNKRDGTEDRGSANYNLIVNHNIALSTAFGANYVDTRRQLIDACVSSDPADYALDRPGSSMTDADGLHPNNAGYDTIAASIAGALH